MKLFESGNLRNVGYIFVIIGIILFLIAQFVPNDSTSKELYNIKKIQSMQGGLIFFALGLILVSVNR